MTSRPIAALLAKRRPQALDAPAPEATDEAPEGEVAIHTEERLEFGLGAFAGLRESSQESEHFERASTSMETRIDLRRFGSAEELLSSVGADALKAELARLGLKCGGAPPQRAERLWQTKGVALSDLQQA
tara:strand:- start:159 stop:548 length:390 start_codon:yes stop_codon:yes gene_type:complete